MKIADKLADRIGTSAGTAAAEPMNIMTALCAFALGAIVGLAIATTIKGFQDAVH